MNEPSATSAAPSHAATGIQCPLCSGKSAPAFASAEHRMYRCTVCGTAFVWPQPTPEYLEAFYSRFHLTLDEGGGYEQMESRMQSDFPAKVAMAKGASNGIAKPRLLDVGCGKGFYVRAASDAGLDATGIDLSDTAI